MTIDLLSIVCKSRVHNADGPLERDWWLYLMAITVDSIPFLLLCTPETCDSGVCKYIRTQKLIIALQRLTQSGQRCGRYAKSGRKVPWWLRGVGKGEDK